jgi:formate dehydrogenase subunit delta
MVDHRGLKPLCIEAMTGYFRGPKSPNARRVDPTRSDAPTGAEPSFADEGSLPSTRPSGLVLALL